MTPRPIHRWKSFWLGLLVLIFLGGAWVDSMSWANGAAWSRPGIAIYSYISDGALAIGTDNGSDRTPGFDCWRLVGDGSLYDPYFPKTRRDPGRDLKEVQLPFWIILALFLIPWAAFLAWRWWRQRKWRRQQRALTKSPDLAS